MGSKSPKERNKNFYKPEAKGDRPKQKTSLTGKERRAWLNFKNTYFLFPYIPLLCVCLHMHTCNAAHMQRSGDNVWDSVLSFLRMGSKEWTQFFRLGRKCCTFSASALAPKMTGFLRDWLNANELQ